jgi:hypothetical protein
MSDESEILVTISIPGHRIRAEQSGSHVICRVFSGPDGKSVFNGALIFAPKEWESFRQNFTWYGQNYAAELTEVKEQLRKLQEETLLRADVSERYTDPLHYLSGFEPKEPKP